MTVSMHENMLDRRYEGRENVPPPKIEHIAVSVPDERLRLQRLVLKDPQIGVVCDRHLRRHGLTAERLLRNAIARGTLSPDRVPAWLLDHLSDRDDEWPNTSATETVWVLSTSSITTKWKGKTLRGTIRSHRVIPHLDAHQDDLPCVSPRSA
jgi:hypothetical protein